jgi:antitoxin VapB
MALTIRDPETEQLARELAALTGETLTGTIRVALQERLALKKRRCEATNETKGKLCEHRLTRTLTLKFAEVTAKLTYSDKDYNDVIEWECDFYQHYVLNTTIALFILISWFEQLERSVSSPAMKLLLDMRKRRISSHP